MNLPKIDALLKLPLWQRGLIFGLIWLFLAGAFYYFSYSTKLVEKSALRTKLEGLKGDAVKKRAIADNLPKYKAEREAIKEEFKLALAALPNEKEIANLLTSISDAAKSSRLEILTFKPLKETPKGFYAEVTIDMKVTGGFSSLISFFEKVAELPRIVNINGLVITSGKEARGDIMLSATFNVTTFKFLQQPAEMQKEVKK